MIPMLLSILLLLLSACRSMPADIGLTSKDWGHLSTAQHTQLRTDYQHLKKTRIQRLRQHATHEQVAQGIEVHIEGGRAMMPPFTQATAYQAVTVRIPLHACRNIPLHSTMNHGKSVRLMLCYEPQWLWLDPSHYDASKHRGTLRLTRSSLWYQGFTYRHISSTGHVRLQGVDVSVRLL